MKEDDKFKKIFSKNLKYWTRNNFKTQADIVKDLQIPCSTVNDWYKGKNYPRIATIKKLADYFGIQIIDLIEEKINLKNIEEEIKVGEYVNGKKVDSISQGYIYEQFDFDTATAICNENNIETIVTKEQFESISYKVKE